MKKSWFVLLLLCSGCILDNKNIDGRLVKMDGKYYRLDCRAGNVYAFEEIKMDTIIVSK